MNKPTAIVFAAIALMLLACSHKQNAPEKPMDAKDTVIGDDIRALEKAKGVQDTLNQDKANTDKAIDTATDAKLPVSTD
jgi:hypothetical protein